MEKQCSECLKIYEISFFYKNHRTKDGYTYWCKKCTKEKNAVLAKNNKEMHNKRKREWERDNRERRRSIESRYRKQLPDSYVASIIHLNSKYMNSNMSYKDICSKPLLIEAKRQILKIKMETKMIKKHGQRS